MARRKHDTARRNSEMPASLAANRRDQRRAPVCLKSGETEVAGQLIEMFGVFFGEVKDSAWVAFELVWVGDLPIRVDEVWRGNPCVMGGCAGLTHKEPISNPLRCSKLGARGKALKLKRALCFRDEQAKPIADQAETLTSPAPSRLRLDTTAHGRLHCAPNRLGYEPRRFAGPKRAYLSSATGRPRPSPRIQRCGGS